MTLQETLHKMLVSSFLLDEEATAVIELAKADPMLQEIHNHWNDPTEGYPTQLLAAVWDVVKHIAVAWLQVQRPKHFALWVLQDGTA